MAGNIVTAFRERAENNGTDYLETVLNDVMSGDKSLQDSRHYISPSKRKKTQGKS